ncbi:MAG: ABC transporter permease [Symploca sp. SIO1B1]|nr:ABC transporter permease [Symploca sp. SIO1C2]NER49773.1 ABC transporter permease [Symploca sp. SIO1A3]NER97926.1 ABC transporter permease [Symploca sp. SIO1B1]
MVSLARKNLIEDIPRFIVAQAGIMFAVSLVALQTGIFNGFTRSTAQLIDNADADIWVASEKLVQIELTMPIPLTHLIQAQKVEGVERAEALISRSALWVPVEGELAVVRVLGFDPQGQLFTPNNITQGTLQNLKKPYSVMLDQANLKSLHVESIGDVGRVNSLPAELVGLTTGNNSIVSSAFMFTSLENAKAYLTSGRTSEISCQLPSAGKELVCTNSFAGTANLEATTEAPNPPEKLVSSDVISYILIRAKPGEDLQALKEKLETTIPDIHAYTHDEFTEKNRIFWQQRTGIGFILSLGAAVGVMVGTIIVGQILYSSVSDHLKEFGTLKAIGASNGTIYGVIIEQALWMSILGYTPSMLICYGVASWAFTTQGILILITPVSAIAILGVTVTMCVGSAIFAIQKVTRLDPAVVFKA